jgi:hypothetical protein
MLPAPRRRFAEVSSRPREELLYDTIALAEAELRLHLGTARDAFAEHRRAMNAPNGGPQGQTISTDH